MIFKAVLLWAVLRGLLDALTRRPDLEGRLAAVMRDRKWREADRALRELARDTHWLIWSGKILGASGWGPAIEGPRFVRWRECGDGTYQEVWETNGHFHYGLYWPPMAFPPEGRGPASGVDA